MHIRWDPFRMDNFDLEGYIENMNILLQPSNFSIIPPWAEKYESISVPIASSLESPSSLELKSPLVTLEYVFLKSSDILPVPIASDSTPNIKIQFMSILEEQIGKIFNK